MDELQSAAASNFFPEISGDLMSSIGRQLCERRRFCFSSKPDVNLKKIIEKKNKSMKGGKILQFGSLPIFNELNK